MDINIDELLRDPNIPKVYGNGFIVSATPTELVLLIQQYGKVVQTINFSHVAGKSLLGVLDKTIKHMETTTGSEIKDIGEMRKLLEKDTGLINIVKRIENKNNESDI